MKIVIIVCLIVIMQTSSAIGQVPSAKVADAVEYTVLFNPSQGACGSMLELTAPSDHFIVKSVFNQGAYIVFAPNAVDTQRAVATGVTGMLFKGKCEQTGSVLENLVGVGTADSAVRCRPFAYTVHFHVDSATKQYSIISEKLRLINTVAVETRFSGFDLLYADGKAAVEVLLKNGLSVTQHTMPAFTAADTFELRFTPLISPPDSIREMAVGYLQFHAQNTTLDTTMIVRTQFIFDPLRLPTSEHASVTGEEEIDPLRVYYGERSPVAELTISERTSVSLVVTDLVGKVILEPVRGQQLSGVQTFELPQTPGFYIVCASIGRHRYIEKVLVQ